MKRHLFSLRLWTGSVLVGLSFPFPSFAKGGGGFFGPIFSIVTTVALVALSFTPLAPMALAAQAATALGFAETASMITAVAASTAFQVVSGITALESIGTASACLGGVNSWDWSGCHGEDGYDTSSSPTPSQASVDANTVTVSSLNTGTSVTCPDGYTLTQDGASCIPNGYISCASVGHPDLMCPDDNVCTTGGQCQPVSGGSCSSSRGQACVSVANSCGATNQATRICDGSCPATVPGEAQCAPPNISLSEVPSLVNPGHACTVSWTVTNATSCSLASDLGDSVASTTLPTGSHDSPNLNSQVTYTMLCHNGSIVTSQASVTCHINPQYGEI